MRNCGIQYIAVESMLNDANWVNYSQSRSLYISERGSLVITPVGSEINGTALIGKRREMTPLLWRVCSGA